MVQQSTASRPVSLETVERRAEPRSQSGDVAQLLIEQSLLEIAEQALDPLSIAAETFGVEPLGARDQSAVLGLLARGRFDLGQSLEARGELFRAEVGGIAEDAAFLLTRGDRGHLDLQRAVDVVGEAHVDRLSPRGPSRHANPDLAYSDVLRGAKVLALVDLDIDRGLVVVDGEVAARAADRDDGVALDQRRHRLAFRRGRIADGDAQGE